MDRRAADTVTWSCRCANGAGATNDGDHYCTCPSGLTCTPVVSGLGAPSPLDGSYCVKREAAHDGRNACTATCDPALHNCP